MSLDGPPIPIAKRVEVLFAVDVSGSMAVEGKIQSVNSAIEEALPFMRQAQQDIVGIEPWVRVLTFGSTVEWVGSPERLAEFWWPHLQAEPQGMTELGAALDAIVDLFDVEPPEVPTPIILLTDGMPTDTGPSRFVDALARLDAHPMGSAGSRVAVAIGDDADRDTLDEFVARVHGQVLSAHNPQQVAAQVRIAGASVLRSASEPIW